MVELVGYCSSCNQAIYCRGGFLDGTVGEAGALLCFICDSIAIKRVYAPCSPQDGKRILVDRLWPRGLSKKEAKVDMWVSQVAPSPKLRRWFGHRPERFEQFRYLYLQELDEDPVQKEKIQELLNQSRTEKLSLLFAAKDTVYNHAVVLQEVLVKLLRNNV